MASSDGLARRLRLPVLGVVLVYAYGVVGYLLFGFGWVDAVTQTALALTTVGFSIQVPLSDGAKLFTASLALAGVSLFLILLAVLGAGLVEGNYLQVGRRRRMQSRIERMRDHYTVARELESEGVPFVVIEQREDLEDLMRYEDVTYLVGSPSSESVLRLAGVERARGLVCAVDSDTENVYIALTARALNPDIFIVARAGKPESPDRLLRAGANRVISPYVTSGRHMAVLAVHPEVTDYLDLEGTTGGVRLEQLAIEPSSPLVGRTLGEACGDAVPMLLLRSGGERIPNPAVDERVREGDLVIVFGESAQPRAGRPESLGRRA
jgi:voltage-gated potassium channel